MPNPPTNDNQSLTPLALMLALMREKWASGDRDGAVKLACAAAPYLHARRTTAARTTMMPAAEAHLLSDADLCQRLADAGEGADAPDDDP